MSSLTSGVLTQAPHPTAVPPSAVPHQPPLLRAAARAVWHALQRAGQERASRELRRQADRWVTRDPALSRQLREASRFDPLAGTAGGVSVDGMAPADALATRAVA